MKKYKYTYHAIKKMLERNLNEETVEFVIRHADYTINRFEDEIEAFKKMNGKSLKVVYVEKENYIKIITLYWVR